MKKIIIILTLIISFSCKSQNVVDSNTLTINGVNILGKDKSILISNFGQPNNIEKSVSEMDEKDMYYYKYNGTKFVVIDNIIDTFQISNSNFLFTSNKIKVGNNINTLKDIFPISYNEIGSKHLSLQIKDNDMYVSIHYDDITRQIRLIRIGTY